MPHVNALLHLPDDILIEIASHLRLDDLLILRQASKLLRRSLDEHMGTLGSRIASRDFSGVVLRATEQRNSVAYLCDLRHRQLAAITVERHDAKSWQRHKCNISANDPLGDRVRHKVYLAWTAVHSMSIAARRVREERCPLTTLGSVIGTYHQPQRLTLGQYDSYCALKAECQSTSWAGTVRQEMAVAQRWLEYLGRLGLEDLQGLQHLVESVIPQVLNEHAGNPYTDHDDWHSPGKFQSFKMVTWALWILFKIGPVMFWRAWSEMPTTHGLRTYLSDSLHSQWHQTDRDLAFVQCELSRFLWQDLKQRMRSRVFVTLTKHFPSQRDSRHICTLVGGLSYAIPPITAYRKEQARSQDEPQYPPVYQHVPFRQCLRLDDNLGLQALPLQMPACYMRGDPDRVPAQKQMEQLQAETAFEDRVLRSIENGTIVLPA